MQITGQLLIGQRAIDGQPSNLRGIDPTSGQPLQPAFGSATASHVSQACALAAAAFDDFRQRPAAQRAQLLEAIGEEILALGDALIERAGLESGLPSARLQGERARTVGQLKLFADLLRDGRWLDARIDPAQPQRQPLPRADLRQQRIALGPVVVFGASNFPLAFSVAGGDTASALAAGCPVVVKGHPAHPGTGELVGRAIQRAVARCQLPEGVFSLLNGSDNALGEQLVSHPAIAAVGFTGSRRGGLALVELAARRAVPIPVYAEMSAINPVYLLPAALAQRGAAIALGFADSLTLGSGQFCTNPGLLLGIEGPQWQAFLAAAGAALQAKTAGVMLTAPISQAYAGATHALAAQPGVRTLAQGLGAEGDHAQAQLFSADAETFLANPRLSEEMFGPAALAISCRDEQQLLAVTAALEGQLTATLQLDEADHALARRLLPLLERKVGRILANGFPTGVEVCHAMVHGGPYPATSDSRTTSVGSAAIERFLRPVCYQDLPDALLPEALQAANPLGLTRLVDGRLMQA